MQEQWFSIQQLKTDHVFIQRLQTCFIFFHKTRFGVFLLLNFLNVYSVYDEQTSKHGEP